VSNNYLGAQEFFYLKNQSRNGKNFPWMEVLPSQLATVARGRRGLPIFNTVINGVWRTEAAGENREHQDNNNRYSHNAEFPALRPEAAAVTFAAVILGIIHVA